MPADRLLPSDEARAIVEEFRTYAQDTIASRVRDGEWGEKFPGDLLRELARMGLMALPYAKELGGAGMPYEVYLQALEEVAGPWMGLGVAASVHTMTCWGLSEFGTDEQKERLLRPMLAGDLIGGYGLSERDAGSDVAGITTAARRDGDDWVIDGEKFWIGPAGLADYYITFARAGEGRSALTAFWVPGDAEGMSFPGSPKKLGMRATPVGAIRYDGVRVPDANRIGEVGAGMRIALGGLDRGRMGIAAVATGVAQQALDEAGTYALGRKQFGQAIADFQGLQFMLADMAAAVGSARATYVDAARRQDAGLAVSREAAIAKMVASDNAMRVCTDAVQVLGGNGYTEDYNVERYFREVKVTQIFEGTNQVQRIVIARHLLNQLKEN